MKLILIILFICIFQSCAAQKGNIGYVLPDNVENELNQLIKNDEKNVFSYYLLLKRDSSVYSITLFKFKKNAKQLNKWSQDSNRKVIVDKMKIPLIFDYDFEFGTTKTNEIGVFGKRDGNIRRNTIVSHNREILFKADGTIINMK